MRKFTKIMTAGLAAATLAGSFAVAVEANAQPRRHYGRHYDRHDRTGAAVAAGIAGLALGAALSDRGRGYYDYGPRYGYRPGYYAPRAYGYYEPRGYYHYPRYRGRACTFWEYDRWGRAYPVRGWC